MMNIRSAAWPVTLVSLLAVSAPSFAKATACAVTTESQIAALFDGWNDALRTQDPDKVVARYARDGVLLATVSNQPRTTPAEIRDYFVKFLKDAPQGRIDWRSIKIGCNVAQDVGTYAFSFSNGQTVLARYTYVYEWRDGRWLISHHHSSAMPEPVAR